MSGPEDKDYAHTHDPQARRSRTELFVIFGVVAVILLGSLIWRAVGGHHPGPQKGWGPTRSVPANLNGTPAAGAPLAAHGAGGPP